jgi:heme/copper-type cytochrome/quinol oxidase subunit 2
MVLIVLFVVGGLFLVLDQGLNRTVDNVDSSIEGTAYEDTANKLNFVWSYFPIVVVFGLILILYISAQRRPNY